MVPLHKAVRSELMRSSGKATVPADLKSIAQTQECTDKQTAGDLPRHRQPSTELRQARHRSYPLQTCDAMLGGHSCKSYVQRVAGASHCGRCSSVLDTNPRGVGRGVRRGGGGDFVCHFGVFLIPRFILNILNIHKWGEFWCYHSLQMKKIVPYSRCTSQCRIFTSQPTTFV